MPQGGKLPGAIPALDFLRRRYMLYIYMCIYIPPAVLWHFFLSDVELYFCFLSNSM